MPTQNDRINRAVVQLEEDTALLHTFRNGTEDETVDTIGGPTPTIAGLAKEVRIKTEINAQQINIATEAAQSSAQYAKNAEREAQRAADQVSVANEAAQRAADKSQFANEAAQKSARDAQDANDAVQRAEELIENSLFDKVSKQDLANPDKGAAMVARGVVAVDSIADLLALPEGQRKEGLRYLVKEYHAGTGLGGGEFYWDADSTVVENGGTVFGDYLQGRWIRREKGAVYDVDFGLVDDPTLLQDQSERFRALFAHGGVVMLTPAYRYHIAGAAVENPNSITLVGDPDNKTLIVGAGQNLISPKNDLRIKGVEALGFKDFINANGLPVFSTLEVVKCFIHDCVGLMGGAVNVDYLIFEGNEFRDFSSYLVLSGSEALIRASFSDNVVEDITRYVWRVTTSGPLFFERNHINRVTYGGFTGSTAVARVIMGGSSSVIYIRNNVIERVISGDANANLIYWGGTNRSLVVDGNVFGLFKNMDPAGASGGYVINDKSTASKSLTFTNNHIQGSDGEFTSIAFIFMLMHDVNKKDCVIAGNTVDRLDAPLAIFFNDLLVESALFSAVVSNNNISTLNTHSLVLCQQGSSNVSISGNVVRNFANPANAAVSFERRKSLLKVILTGARPLQATNLSVVNNVVRFTNDGEETPLDSCFVVVSALHTENEINVFISGNTGEDIDFISGHRNSYGTIRVVQRSNLAVGDHRGDHDTPENITLLDSFGNANIPKGLAV